MMDDPNNPYAALAQMDPAVLDELMRLGTLDERNALLEQQIAQAQALRQPDNAQHYSALGGVLGGLNSAIGNIYGTYKTEKAAAEQQNLLKQKDAGRGLYVQEMMRLYGRTPVTTDVPMDVVPPTAFSL